MTNYFQFYVLCKHLTEIAKKGHSLDDNVNAIMAAVEQFKLDEDETND
jgi:hypothetical protein